MNVNKQSLISRVARKNVLTPYEAIIAQYINNEHIKQIPESTNESNIYLIPKVNNPLISYIQLKDLVSFNTLQQNQEYDGYRWAANLLMSFDKGSGEVVYKGIALLNELRYFRNECIIQLYRDDETTPGTLLEFCSYSHIHQKSMTFEELIQSVSSNFQLLIRCIDNVLTLNYFLKGMIEIPQLLTIEGLKLFLAKENLENEDVPLDIAQLCYETLTDTVINNNHPDFIELMKIELAEFSWNLSANFQEESLMHVKKSLAEIII